MFKLTIKTDNAAFEEPNALHEIARILRDAAQRIAQGHSFGGCFDINGNKVGSFDFVSE